MIVSPRLFASDYCSNAEDASASLPWRQNILIPRERQTVKRRKRKEDPPAITAQRENRGISGGRCCSLPYCIIQWLTRLSALETEQIVAGYETSGRTSLLQNNER